ncbi:DNA polymerase III subunit gamma and tau, partial [Nocardia alni]|uniref:DNA polymerase III subunit gamma and tau n=1 Tax=Nocardia alni TaxID=2815723 RepID=UPI001C228F57
MALYRKYRPATFAEVVGQEHVTEPLSTALDTGRISHAYLFSGPRGCGKTSSARILARSLNCAEGPTSRPCGVCSSCVALGPGGPGNLDVIELDAASHGGVDDTRELRDRAFYAPAESRYRVFIVDEAHMVTTAGFNALLKIVEEPPAHLIFVFATTEPDKVLPTIRSRTHHYPFRLLPPATMRGLLGKICEQEHVPVEEAVYPLVIRAGGGSPRDSLSVLDQLLAGAGPEGVTYPRALSLLGVTDIALIDDAVEALAAADGAALFGAVDRVVEAGHDPRRFAGDLLERMRDLILLRAVPNAAERNLVTGPGDVLERMRDQAQRVGPAALARYADLLHTGLGEMRGATAPRLLLEVVCARMLLPGASDTESATLQRLERLESRVAGGVVAPAAPGASRPPHPAPAPEEQPPAAPAPSGSPSGSSRRRGAEALAAIRESRPGSPAGEHPAAAPESAPAASESARVAPESAPVAPESAPGSQASASTDTAAADGATGAARSNAAQLGEQRPHPAQRAQASRSESSGVQPDSEVSPAAIETEESGGNPALAQSGTSDDTESTARHQDSDAAMAPAPAEFAFAPGTPAVEASDDAARHDDSAEDGVAPQDPVAYETPAEDSDIRGAADRDAGISDPAVVLPAETAPPADDMPPVDAASPVDAPPVSESGPAPEPIADSARDAAESGGPSGDAALHQVEAAWGDIRAKVREFGAAVHALLSGASVARLEGDTVVLAHQHAPLAQRLSNPKYLEAVQSAIAAVLGRDYGVRWEVAGAAPARP